MTSQWTCGDGDAEDVPSARNYVIGNYVAGNYIAKVCVCVAVKTWRGVNGHRRRPSPLPPDAVPTVRYNYHVYLPLISFFLLCIVILFLRNLSFSVYYMRLFMHKYFLFRRIIILESVITCVIRYRKEGTNNCRHRDIFILDIYLCHTYYLYLSYFLHS